MFTIAGGAGYDIAAGGQPRLPLPGNTRYGYRAAAPWGDQPTGTVTLLFTDIEGRPRFRLVARKDT